MPAAGQPNILLLFCDQFRFDAMGCAGNRHVQTPNLDRLAARGTRFARGYSPVPVCVPARQGLFTGHYCSVHGRYSNARLDREPQIPYLAELLGLAGYRTHSIGKMHFHPFRRHYGFQRREVMEEIPHYRDDDDYLLYLEENGFGDVREVHGIRNILYHLPQVSLIPEEHHGSTWVADRSVEFLRNHARRQPGRPFFLVSSWIAPHPPWNPPEPFASMYDPASLPLPNNWDRPAETIPPALRGRMRMADVGDASAEMLQRIKALYYGSVSLIDKGVGRILDTLDELGLSGDTLVIFTADHGEMLGDQHMFQKMNPYEPASHIPFLMCQPGTVAAGRVSEELVSLLDIMPTALELAGTEYPGEKPLPGQSLLGHSGGGLGHERRYLVTELGRGSSRWVNIYCDRWRYAYYLAGGWEELYDLEADPTEAQNLLLTGDAAHLKKAAELKAELEAWEKVHGDSDSLDEHGHFKALERPTRHRRAQINNQLPTWLDPLSPSEMAQMRGMGESLLAAISSERTFTLEDLKKSGSLEQWRMLGGTLRGTPYAHLLGEEEEDTRPAG